MKANFNKAYERAKKRVEKLKRTSDRLAMLAYLMDTLVPYEDWRINRLDDVSDDHDVEWDYTPLDKLADDLEAQLETSGDRERTENLLLFVNRKRGVE